MNRPLAELKLRAGMLAQVENALREECVAIAREKSPSSAFDLASIAARQRGMAGMQVIGVAKATRWLAVIRRDHGDNIFNEAVRTLSAPTPTA
tara:strand:+ start:3277 stop:3555 length:279 start_codon:yes stop_codon:yes gene_type:complete